MSPTEIDHPYLNLHFRLDIDGLGLASFSECTGLGSDIGTEDYAEGGENRFVYKLPTRRQAPNLVLKRGVTDSVALWTWFGEYLRNGAVSLRTGQVQLLAWPETGTEARIVRCWSFSGGYPVRVTGPDLNAQSPGVAIESVEIAHRGLEPA